MYPAMVAQQWALPSSALHHVVARIDGEAIGYHTFLRTGRRLVLLSGVFDRHESGNVHAYENVLLESVKLAVDAGCTVVDYGGTVNEVKASLFTTTPTEIRFAPASPHCGQPCARCSPKPPSEPFRPTEVALGSGQRA